MTGVELGPDYCVLSQALARVRELPGLGEDGCGVAALSLNTHGAEIAIVSRGRVVCSRSFEWPLGTPFGRERPELLERYLIVSELAPHLKHLIELTRPVYGVIVTAALACGNLPNLRSLMMLLIDEVDLEIETLDAPDLLEADAASGGIGESIRALQLATASPARPPARPSVQVFATAAAIVLVAMWSALEVAGSSPARPVFPDGAPLLAEIPAVPQLPAEATMGRIAAPAGDQTAAEPPVVVTQPTSVERVPVPSPSLGRTAPRPGGSATESIPRVDGIMIAGEHKLAIVGGATVAVGDRVGPYVVEAIERGGVVLRDASGRTVFVAIRTRK
jgi:hypothetical protein